MFSVESCKLPPEALLNSYLDSGAYTDCYRTEIPGSVTHTQYVGAFYTTSLFKLERMILAWLASKPSTDREAEQLAQGSTNLFAAWQVESRVENQLLLSDFRGRTRSWLMALPAGEDNDPRTHLYFGSAITKVPDQKTGKMTLGSGFRVLLGFHKIYSRLLLYSARLRLKAQSFGNG
ncbi:MAG: hypothetical protein KJP11_06970 [Gammaproteobacteria bacterium]|nr:hypothetical protein [Gammaproteobacteria bacterium]